MVQQKKKLIEDHQYQADQALYVFNLINSLHGQSTITLSFNSISFTIPGALKNRACSFLQKICEYHITEKHKQLAEIAKDKQYPELPDWFVHYFTFCAEMEIIPEVIIDINDKGEDISAYTVEIGKKGTIFLSFKEPVTYKGYVGKYWQACHSGSFLLLKTSAKWQ